MHIQLQAAQRTPGKINPKITLRSNITKMLKVKDKEIILKATSEKQFVTTKKPT